MRRCYPKYEPTRGSISLRAAACQRASRRGAFRARAAGVAGACGLRGFAYMERGEKIRRAPDAVKGLARRPSRPTAGAGESRCAALGLAVALASLGYAWLRLLADALRLYSPISNAIKSQVLGRLYAPGVVP